MAPIPDGPVSPIDCHAQAKIDAGLPHPNKKRIFVFCDGTGNKFADRHGLKNANSNVVKLYITLRINNDQVAYYHPGVGTMGDPEIRHRIPRFWSKVKGLAFGAGFKANVLDAYRYLMETYNDGDEIYLFGFSRGAYTARALAALINVCGLLCRGNEGHLFYAWELLEKRFELRHDLYTERTPESQRTNHLEADASFSETFSRKVTIRFLGIWDMVSSVGWLKEPLSFALPQSTIVRVVRHAVSIDERRAYYRDNIWGPPVSIDHPGWPEDLRAHGIHQDIAQVWFPGAHSDVGGSYPQFESAPANEALQWMIGELQLHGAELCQERVGMVLGKPTHVYSADAIFTPTPDADFCLHDQLRICPLWWPLQCIPQRYYDKEKERILWRVPYGTPRHIPEGGIIHGSAERRLQLAAKGEGSYTPPNLKLEHLTPLVVPVAGTNANLDGCFLFNNKAGLLPKRDSEALRSLKLAAGALTFGIIIVITVLGVWCLFETICFVALPTLQFLSHAHLLRWIGHLVHHGWRFVAG